MAGDQPSELGKSAMEAKMRQEAEDEARHAMGAVLWIDLSVVVFVVACAAVVLVILFR